LWAPRYAHLGVVLNALKRGFPGAKLEVRLGRLGAVWAVTAFPSVVLFGSLVADPTPERAGSASELGDGHA
jgi:hypothetical protein